MKKIYFVIGGIFTSTGFTALEPGSAEMHGPFGEYSDAERAWKSNTSRKVDICCHRLFIVPVTLPE